MLSDILIEFTIFFLNELFKVHLPVSLWDSCFSFDFDNTVGEDEVCHTLIYNLFSGRTSSFSCHPEGVTGSDFKCEQKLQRRLLDECIEEIHVIVGDDAPLGGGHSTIYRSCNIEVHSWSLCEHINHHHPNKFNKNI